MSAQSYQRSNRGCWCRRCRYGPEAVHHYRGTRNVITFTWEPMRDRGRMSRDHALARIYFIYYVYLSLIYYSIYPLSIPYNFIIVFMSFALFIICWRIFLMSGHPPLVKIGIVGEHFFMR